MSPTLTGLSVAKLEKFSPSIVKIAPPNLLPLRGETDLTLAPTSRVNEASFPDETLPNYCDSTKI